MVNAASAVVNYNNVDKFNLPSYWMSLGTSVGFGWVRGGLKLSVFFPITAIKLARKPSLSVDPRIVLNCRGESRFDKGFWYRGFIMAKRISWNNTPIQCRCGEFWGLGKPDVSLF